MRVRVLGPLLVDGLDDGLPPRDRVVLSVLALRLDDHVEAGVFADALWREAPPPTWAKVVQGCVSRLRRHLGAGAIETTQGGYRLRADAVELDRARFEELISRAREYAATRAPERARRLLEEALSLWRGDPYDALTDWMPGRLEAIRLQELRLAAQEDLLGVRLDAGEHREVAAEGTVLVGEQPYREDRWRLLALAQYRSGRQADALASIRTARRALGRELGLDPGSDLVALEAAILAQDPGLTAHHEARLADAQCPWKGLAPYRAEDQDGFFGRDADVEACLAKLSRSPLLVLAGASGSGKSSLLNAGLVPALRRAGLHVEAVQVGAEGRLAIAAARARARGDPVLVVDQLEDALAATASDAEMTWARELAHYAGDRAWVLVAVRSDQLPALGADPSLARLAEKGLHLVTPLTGPALRRAVEGPARLAGLRLEPGLTDLVLRDAESQPGAMPLLSHALAETWRLREGNLLTVEGYRMAGGISDAVAASAERLYDSIGAPGRAQLRWVMLRLVSMSESGEVFRTTLPASAALDPHRRRVLDELVDARLVTAEQDGFELSHQALVSAWPRLRTWLDEDASGQRLRRHLSLAAAGWEALGRPESELYRGARLEAVLEWLERGNEPLSTSESEFVRSSAAAADDVLRGLAAQARRQRRQNRRLRLLVAGALALLVVAVTAAQVARDRGAEAARGRDAARQAAAIARHETLVGRVSALLTTSRSAAALLALQAWREDPDVLAESALVSVLTSSPGFLGYVGMPVSTGGNASLAPLAGDDLVLASVGSDVATWDASSGQTSATFVRGLPGQPSVPPNWDDSVLRVSADGSRAAHLVTTIRGRLCEYAVLARDGGRGCTALVVYDIAARRAVLGPVVLPFRGDDVALSDDGGLVAVVGGFDGDAAVWDVDRGVRLGRLDGVAPPGGPRDDRPTGAVAFGPDDRLYVGSLAGPLREVSATTLQVRRTFSAPPQSTNISVVRTRSGQLLLTGSEYQQLLDPARGTRIWIERHDEVGGPRDCTHAVVSEAMRTAYCSGSAGRIVERQLSTGRLTGLRLESQLGPVSGLAVVGGGREIVVASRWSWFVARWRLDGAGLGANLLARGMAATGGYDPTGERLLVAPVDDRAAVSVLDVRSRRLTPLPVRGRAVWLSRDRIAVLGRREVIVDLRREEIAPPAAFGSGTVDVFAEEGGTHAWAVRRRPDGYHVVRFSLTSGQPSWQPLGGLAGRPVIVADEESALVTVPPATTIRVDADTGAEIGSGLNDRTLAAFGPGGTVLGAGGGHPVGEYRDLGFTDESFTYPASTDHASSLQVSRDRSRLLVTSPNQTLRLFDTRTRVPFGAELSSQTPTGVLEGWLRPDGRAFVVNTRHGVVLWDLDVARMRSALCMLAGRNLTPPEWDRYVGGDARYSAVCPQLPAPGPTGEPGEYRPPPPTRRP